MLRLNFLRPLKRAIPSSAKRPAKDAYSRGLSAIARIVHRETDPGDAVLLTSSPRSGSTWLMNIVETRPGSCAVFEPLRAEEDPVLRGLFEGYYPRVRTDQHFPEMERYLREVFAGRHFSRWSSNYASFRQLMTSRSFVVKFVRANRMWGWMSRVFPENRKVVLVRHPCAVVSSMARSGGVWAHWGPEDVMPSLRAVFGPRIDSLLARTSSQDELLAACWATDLVTVLAETDPTATLLLTYEGLVRHPESAVARLFAHLQEEVPEEVWSRLPKASWTANRGAAILTDQDPVAAWTRHVSPDRARKILDVAGRFGVHAYSRDLEPDEEILAEAHGRMSGLLV